MNYTVNHFLKIMEERGTKLNTNFVNIGTVISKDPLQILVNNITLDKTDLLKNESIDIATLNKDDLICLLTVNEQEYILAFKIAEV